MFTKKIDFDLFNHSFKKKVKIKDLANVLNYEKDLMNSFSKKFQADACKVLFFKENPNLPKGRVLDVKQAHKQIGKKYNASDIYCGPWDKKESDYIFDKKTKIKDCVLVPIKNTDCPGMLALGSKNEDMYSKENDSLFLEFVAETLSKLIDRNNF